LLMPLVGKEKEAKEIENNIDELSSEDIEPFDEVFGEAEPIKSDTSELEIEASS